MLREVHDYAGYFGAKIVLDHLKFQIFWPKIASDVYEYI